MFDISSGRRGNLPQTTTKDVVDSVVLVVDAEDIVDNESAMERLKEFIALLLKRQMTPVIALSKVDRIGSGSVIEDLGSAFDADEVKSIIYRIHQGTGLPVNLIFPVKSYTIEFDMTSRNWHYFAYTKQFNLTLKKMHLRRIGL
jgi:GTPase Era involved in 16S rRNA processing